MKIKKICKVCNKVFYVHHWTIKERPCKYCSNKCQGKSKEFREKMRLANIGKKRSEKFKKALSFATKGNKNSNWKGGIKKHRGGYVCLHSPNHPFRSVDNYVLEHRLVMEKYIGRYLKHSEHVHHKNGIKNDNRLENLQIIMNKTHHGKVTCPHCNNIFLIK